VTTDASSYTWKPRSVLAKADDVATAFHAGSLARRHAKTVARAARSGHNAQQWWRAQGAEFDRLPARMVRQRSAVIHGRTLTPEVLATVVPFA
jgi:hypothetical protein